jgi:hypothetical protein
MLHEQRKAGIDDSRVVDFSGFNIDSFIFDL